MKITDEKGQKIKKKVFPFPKLMFSNLKSSNIPFLYKKKNNYTVYIIILIILLNKVTVTRSISVIQEVPLGIFREAIL